MTGVVCALLMLTGGAPAAQAREVVAEVRVHGNHLTSDTELLELSGLVPGAPFLPGTIADVTARLRATGRFDDVEVLKRFASIADPTRIVVVIIVNEGPVRIRIGDGPDAAPEVVPRRGLRNLMFLPILDAEDGYGLTYGVRFAFVDVGGDTGRVSFPVSWGGRRQAGIEYDRSIARGPLSRVQVGGSLERRTNPFYDEDDSRRRVWARGERQIGDVRLGAGAAWERVAFGAVEDEVATFTADVIYDTRLTPILPRNAIYARAAVDRVSVSDAARDLVLTHLDLRGYVGLPGQAMVELRARHDDGNGVLPPYLKPLLGGRSSVRGFATGSEAGDSLVAGSAEVFLPLTSVLSAGRFGVSGFLDVATVYDYGERSRDQRFRLGAGGSIWVAITSLRLSLSVARGREGDTRVHFGGGAGF